MNLPGNPSTSRTFAVVLIAIALLGTEFSYHFTLESRFDAIEDKLQQNALAMQQFQSSIDTLSSSKSDTLAELNKEVVALQASFGPLGKETQAQSDSLSQLHDQITTLQQAQNDQLNAQKKLFGSVDQLEKSHLRVRLEPAETNAAPLVVTTPATTLAPPAESHPAAASVLPPTPAVVPPSVPIAPVPTPAATMAPGHPASPHPAPSVSSARPPSSGNRDMVDVHAEDGDGALPSPGMMAAHESEPSESDTFHAMRALPVGAVLTAEK